MTIGQRTLTSVGRWVLASALIAATGLKVEALVHGLRPSWNLFLGSRWWLWGVSVVEAGIAAGLVSTYWRHAAWATLVLVGLFGVALVAFAAGPGVARCGCFGDASVSTAAHLAHIGGLGTLAITLLVPPRGNRREA